MAEDHPHYYFWARAQQRPSEQLLHYMRWTERHCEIDLEDYSIIVQKVDEPGSQPRMVRVQADRDKVPKPAKEKKKTKK